MLNFPSNNQSEVNQNNTVNQNNFVKHSKVTNSHYNFFAKIFLKLFGTDEMNKFLAHFGNENAKLNVRIIRNFTGETPPTTTIHSGDTIEAYKNFMAEVQQKSDRMETKETKITVQNTKTMDAARYLKADNKKAKIAVLNLGNRIRPGGVGSTFHGGSQEEDLIRNSNLLHGINKKINKDLKESINSKIVSGAMVKDSGDKMRHHIPTFGALHSSNVAFLDKNKVDTRQEFDVISAAGIDLRIESDEHDDYFIKDEQGKSQFATEKFKVATQMKINAILGTALLNEDRNLVLGALGCGAFKNDPNIVAECFKEALNSDLFRGKFDNVIFAIYAPGQKGSANFEIFQQNFISNPSE